MEKIHRSDDYSTGLQQPEWNPKTSQALLTGDALNDIIPYPEIKTEYEKRKLFQCSVCGQVSMPTAIPLYKQDASKMYASLKEAFKVKEVGNIVFPSESTRTVGCQVHPEWLMETLAMCISDAVEKILNVHKEKVPLGVQVIKNGLEFVVRLSNLYGNEKENA